MIGGPDEKMLFCSNQNKKSKSFNAKHYTVYKWVQWPTKLLWLEPGLKALSERVHSVWDWTSACPRLNQSNTNWIQWQWIHLSIWSLSAIPSKRNVPDVASHSAHFPASPINEWIKSAHSWLTDTQWMSEIRCDLWDLESSSQSINQSINQIINQSESPAI